MHRFRLAILATAALAGSCAGGRPAAPPAAPAASVPAVIEMECPFPTGSADVQCGTIEVWENRAARSGRRIPVFFTRFRATGDNPLPDPMVELVGGPGQHASQTAFGLLLVHNKRNRQRDLLVVDQRGTGHSNPLDCFGDGGDADDFRALFTVGFFDPAGFRRCRDELSARADLTQYTTTAIAHDLEELRRALKYEKLNLLGSSYGTRLALEYLRRYPDSVRSVILRGVAPPSDLLVERVARDMQDNLDSLVADCMADADCSAAYPDLAARLREALERVRRAPVEAEFTNPVTKKKERLPLHYAQLVTGLRFQLYSARMSAAIPRQVEQALAGDYSKLAAMFPTMWSLREGLAEGMWASVKCTEELPFIDVERARRMSAGTALGTIRLDDERAICEFWPRGEMPDDFHEPVVSDVPVLLIAGELDTASPLELAENAAKHLGRGTLVAVRKRSHWGLGQDACIEGLVDAFLAAGHGAGLDTSCAENYTRPAFVLP